MNKNIILYLFVFLFSLPLTSTAQRWKLRRYEASFGLAATKFFGDVGGTADADNAMGFKDIQIQYIRPAFVFTSAFKITGDMNIKMNLVYGFIKGDDIGSKNEVRNYAFKSSIFEPSFQFEYYLIPETRSFASSALFNRRGMVNNYSKVFIYIYGGVGGIYSNPKPQKDFVANFDNNFSKFGVTFPVGIGAKFTLDSKWSLGVDFGRRFTLTDYIDGYTTEFSKHKDTYYIGSFSAIYKIRADRRGLPVLRRQYRRF